MAAYLIKYMGGQTSVNSNRDLTFSEAIEEARLELALPYIDMITSIEGVNSGKIWTPEQFDKFAPTINEDPLTIHSQIK